MQDKLLSLVINPYTGNKLECNPGMRIYGFTERYFIRLITVTPTVMGRGT
ncbi:MAG: hypothetical protein IBX64_08360 [Actinobacteria bacterium]|nr:hypothetical protein [Actinomycetota bacterium]